MDAIYAIVHLHNLEHSKLINRKHIVQSLNRIMSDLIENEMDNVLVLFFYFVTKFEKNNSMNCSYMRSEE